MTTDSGRLGPRVDARPLFREWQAAFVDLLRGLDAARDFTEYWTHHQQICDALGRPGLTGLLGTVLDTFLRALPHTLRDVDAPTGTAVAFTVTGHGTWTGVRGPDGWALGPGPVPAPDACVEVDADTAWRLCTRGITPAEAARRARAVEGDPRLTGAALTIVSIIHSPSPGE